MNVNSKSKIISIHSAKGGTGKTTLLANLAVYLAKNHHRTLAIDFDFFTQGLTLFLAKGLVEFTNCITTEDLMAHPVENNKEVRFKNSTLHEISDDLFLLPTSNNVQSEMSERLIQDIHPDINDSSYFPQSIIRNLKRLTDDYKIEYVLIDARSGIDYWCIVPTLVADLSWVVCEEDRTSQRASRMLQNEIIRLKGKVKNIENVSRFDGFVLNMVVSPMIKDLIKFYESTVFGASCIAAIPLSRQVRRAFVKDEIVVERYPDNIFSSEIRAIGDMLINKTMISALTRVQSHLRKRWFKRVIPASFLIVIIAAMAATLDAMGLPLGISLVSLMVTGSLLILTLYFYLQTD